MTETPLTDTSTMPDGVVPIDEVSQDPSLLDDDDDPDIEMED